jgi:hypothetical protein
MNNTREPLETTKRKGMKKATEITTQKQKGPWKKGQSGNPAGRPKGARHKSTMAALALLEGEAQALTRKAIEEAMGGNMVALKLCLERLVPPAKERPVDIAFPEISDASDLAKLTAALLTAVGNGNLDPGQAASLAKVVETHRNTLELTEIQSRLQKIEESINEKRNN